MEGPCVVYGSPGSRSVPVEAALTLIGAHYQVIGETVLRDVACNPDVIKVKSILSAKYPRSFYQVAR